MSLRPVSLALKSFGYPPSRAEILVRQLSARERLRRAGILFAAGLGVALVALPIPLVHLVLPPAALVLGLAGGLRRLGQAEVFERAEAECPSCHTRQRLNLTGSAFRLPQRITCSHCLQPLRLENEAWSGSAPAGS
jgi:hypothetical protein